MGLTVFEWTGAIGPGQLKKLSSTEPSGETAGLLPGSAVGQTAVHEHRPLYLSLCLRLCLTHTYKHTHAHTHTLTLSLFKEVISRPIVPVST